MENQEAIQNLRDKILQKIQTGEVKMRPKAYFIVKIATLVFVAFVTFVVSVLLVSYTWFNLRAGGHIFLLGFGRRGFFEFFLVFPWFLLLCDVLLILFLDWLLKRFKFGYHNPVLFVFLGSLLVITISGTVVNMTSFHPSVMKLAEQKHLPVPGVEGFYSGLRKTHSENGLYRGEVVSLATSSFVMRNANDDIELPDGGVIRVFTPLGFSIESVLQVGDHVFVAGDVTDVGIQAYGIRKLTLED